MEESIITELRKFVAPEFIYGVGARGLAGRCAKKFGCQKALLVSDPGVAKAGWMGEVNNSLLEAGLSVDSFLDISPNPRDYEVMAGAEKFSSGDCDVIVSVGGGSVMDCAKGIGIVVNNGGNIIDYQGVDRIPIPMPPLVCIPTTGGTSADVSQFAIINYVQEKVKIAIISKSVVPDVALIDPQTLITMDPYLTACTGMDALVHAIEAFVSNAHSPITDIHALEAIRLISTYLRHSVKELDNIEIRNHIMQASLQAGLAFSNASLGTVHAMAHSLGGYKDLPHGECNALLLPHVMDFNFSASPERYFKIGEALGCNLQGLTEKEKFAEIFNSIVKLREDCGISGGLSQRGINNSDISRLATKAINDPCNATNPRSPSERDIEAIFGESM